MNNLRILRYCRISDADVAPASGDQSLPAPVFERHIDWLERFGYTTITFDDLRLCQIGELSLPRKPVIITFDGGHLDTFHHAFPLLQQRGMKAVFFVLGDRSLRTTTAKTDGTSSVLPLMDDQHLVELHEAGCEIGSMSLTNRKLTSLDSHSAWEEILRSRMNLEIVLNARVRCFAYPCGETNEAVRAMVVQAQYSYACIYEGTTIWPSRDAYEVRRTQMGRSQGLSGAALRIMGVWPLRPGAMPLDKELHPSNQHGDF